MTTVDEFMADQSYEYNYGPFPGGDPRDFLPDEDLCTDDEKARHVAACVEWAEGIGVDRGPSCKFLGDSSVITGTGFGIGIMRHPRTDDDD